MFEQTHLILCKQSSNTTREKHLSGAPLEGRPLALPTNIKLGWKSLPVTNTFILIRKSVNYGCNEFYSTGPCGLYYKRVMIVKLGMLLIEVYLMMVTYARNLCFYQDA